MLAMHNDPPFLEENSRLFGLIEETKRQIIKTLKAKGLTGKEMLAMVLLCEQLHQASKQLGFFRCESGYYGNYESYKVL